MCGDQSVRDTGKNAHATVAVAFGSFEVQQRAARVLRSVCQEWGQTKATTADSCAIGNVPRVSHVSIPRLHSQHERQGAVAADSELD